MANDRHSLTQEKDVHKKSPPKVALSLFDQQFV